VDGSHSDAPAIEGLVNIGLVYHGTREMTDAQKKYFS
jgi:nitrate reductase NapAB chaperone NapD